MLIGGTTSSLQVKEEDEITDKMLEGLKHKLLSSRDKFILSNKDTLPDFQPQKNDTPSLFKQSSIISDATLKREEAVKGGTKQEPPVLTGQFEKKSAACK